MDQNAKLIGTGADARTGSALRRTSRLQSGRATSAQPAL